MEYGSIVNLFGLSPPVTVRPPTDIGGTMLIAIAVGGSITWTPFFFDAMSYPVSSVSVKPRSDAGSRNVYIAPETQHTSPRRTIMYQR